MDARIENYHGSPALMVNGEAIPPMLAKIRTSMRTSLKLDPEYFRHLGEAGFRVFLVICDLEWTKPGAMKMFREECETILREVPDALFLPCLGLHPSNEWMDAHPEAWVQYSDGTYEPCHLYTESFETMYPAMYSMCSEEWRRDAGIELEKTLHELETLPFGERIIGVSLMAGGTSEWQYKEDVIRPGSDTYTDCGPSFRAEFSAYLKEQYGDEAGLRKAWRDPEASLSHPHIPTIPERFFADDVENKLLHPGTLYATSPKPAAPDNGTSVGTLADVDKYQSTADYYRAWQLGSANSAVYFGAVAKRVWPNRVTATVYGSWGCVNFLKNSDTSGTMRIIESGMIDMLIAPGVYQNRQPGGFTGQREMGDSLRLHNQIFMISNDTRTHHENAFYRNLAETFDANDTANVVKRDFGCNLSENAMAYWFDQHIGGGRFNDPATFVLLRRQQEIAHFAYTLDRTKRAEIAFIFDEESAALSSNQTTFDTVEFVRDYEIAKIGAPVDQYFHNDMALDTMPPHKLYVFWNVFSLTEPERQVIKARLQKEHATALWMYASGFIKPEADKRMDARHMSELTGIGIKMGEGDLSPKFRFLPDNLLNMDEAEIYGFNYRPMPSNIFASYLYNRDSVLYPWFYADDAEAQALGRYLENGLTAAAMKDCGGWRSIFVGTKMLRADALREIARLAGCHIWCDTDDVTYESDEFVTLHASFTGDKTLRFPCAASPWEVYEKKLYAENVSELTLHMKKGETKTFALHAREE